LNVVCDVSQRQSLNAWFYNEYYQAILHSQAHSLFCERVYGKDLGQHGMADMGQLQVMLSELQVKPGMALLDFGCGDGQISEHIAEITQTCVTGVDFAELAIKLAQDRTRNKRDRVQFEWVDLEKKPGSFPPVNFDCILAIDSVFFAQDQNAVTQQLLNHLKPGGIMGVFYICPPHVWAPETTFAKALDGLGVSYRVRDFSIQNTQHWKKKKQTLLELEPMFMEEGNAFLLKNRLAECDGLANFHRYLYIVTNS
jgi:cyclopropane fatty-acyl-phospholipid synthase-like methyltransferase